MTSAKGKPQSKAAVRQEVKRRIAAMTLLQRREYSTCICEHLRRLPVVQKADILLVYAALPDEADPLEIAQWAAKRDIAVGYPVTVSENRSPRLQFRRLPPDIPAHTMHGTSADDLPDEELVPTGSTVIIAPGRAFTSTGDRVGRGGGYYDSYIAHWRRRSGCIVLGIAFSVQLFPQLPHHPHDMSVDAVYTELST
ncbi:MAG: 5-formyltetrahydrofolate cyclo-ligase [Spirochaeta sp.]